MLAAVAVVLAFSAPLVTRLDGLVGIGLALIAAVAVWTAPRNWFGLLVGGAAVAWFAANMAASGAEGVARVAAWLVFVHRALLAHGAIVMPRRRLRRVVWPAIGVMYLLTAPAIVRSSAAWAVMWAAAVIVAAVAAQWPQHLPRTPDAVLSGAAATIFAATVGLEVRGDAYRWLLLLGAAVALNGVVVLSRRQARVADFVVESLHGPSGGARSGLGRALGDPDVQLAFAAGDGWVDETGRPMAELHASAGRVLSVIEDDEDVVAAVVHLPEVAADPVLRRALRDATVLAAKNVRLRTELRQATAEVKQSRRRLVEADRAARMQFAELLRLGPDAHLAAAASALAGSTASNGSNASDASRMISQIRVDFDDVIDGLGPLTRFDGDLQAALRALAALAPVEVHLDIDVGPTLRAAIAEVLWFVAAEGVANVVKHTSCSEVRVALRVSAEQATLTVDDDGGGGADPEAGTGLVGLADRVQATGGHLRVVPTSRGTCLMATVPLD